MVGIIWRNDHTHDRCNLLRTTIRVAFAPKGLDLFEPFLRGFVTVHRLLSQVEKEGLFSCHLPRTRGRP